MALLAERHVHQRAARRNESCPEHVQDRQNQPAYFLTGLIYSSPIQSAEVAEGRNVNMYVLQDNANWIKGRHSFSFGYQMQLMRVGSSGENGTIPAYGIGISAASPYGFTNQIPGATATDYGRANSLLASLGGLLAPAHRPSMPPARAPASFRARRAPAT